MNTITINEKQSLRVIQSIACVYRDTNPLSRQLTRDIRHIISAYKLCDKEAALACNRYITTKYPMIYKVAAKYGLHRMNETEMYKRSEAELQHMLYNLCIFLYDTLKKQNVTYQASL